MDYDSIYDDLLDELGNLVHTKIGLDLYSSVVIVLDRLMDIEQLIQPSLFMHSNSSVVLNWSNKNWNLYATISIDRVSMLLSDGVGIVERKEGAKNLLPDFSYWIELLQKNAQEAK